MVGFDASAKFVNYDTGGNHDIEKDGVTVTFYQGRTGITDENKTSFYTYKQIFAGIANADNYKKALIVASQNLNKGSDVVTAINDAIDVNYRNSNSYLYNYVEKQNSVEVIVDLGSSRTEFGFNKTAHYQYLVIEPNKNVKPKYVYGSNSINSTGSNEQNKEKNIELNIFKDSNAINVYDMLKELRDTKIIDFDGKTYSLYKYYFLGEVFINETTGLVETVKFTLVKDSKFGEGIT